jgi:hypothetical protein
MKQFKRAKVIMLPTNNKSHIYHTKVNNILGYVSGEVESDLQQFPNQTNTQNQHLYIISDDEIKENDYVYDWYNNKVYKATAVVIHNKKSLGYEYLNKIIATTDISLKIFAGKGDICDLYYNIPQPSQQFIEKYIEFYNKDEVITDVLVEYEPIKKETGLRHTSSGLANSIYYEDELKVNPKDNTITIKKLKDSWNREEHISNLIKYRKDYEQFKKDSHFGPNETEINNWSNKWIEKNL